MKHGEFELGAVALMRAFEAGHAVMLVSHDPAPQKGGIYLKLAGHVAKPPASLEEGLDGGQLELLGILDHLKHPGAGWVSNIRGAVQPPVGATVLLKIRRVAYPSWERLQPRTAAQPS